MIVIPVVGTKVTMVVRGYFGNHVTVKGVIAREPRHHGYIKNGSWALTGGEGWSPCYKFGLKEYRKRIPIIMRMDEIISIDEGW